VGFRGRRAAAFLLCPLMCEIWAFRYFWPISAMIDWSQCPDAESVPDRCSGAWVAKDSRVMVQGILDNADAGCSAEEIADMFTLPHDVVRRILAFARRP
jgi:uncharacterized protein (DUF433 family)